MSQESSEPQFSFLPDSTKLQAINKYRILVADDHALDRSSLIASLATISEVEICGRASNARETVRFAKKMRPDLVILSVNLLAIGGIDTVQRIRGALPGAEVLVVTLHGSPSLRAAEGK
jgi:DNA-binding NarL/FixJ family response regulator